MIPAAAHEARADLLPKSGPRRRSAELDFSRSPKRIAGGNPLDGHFRNERLQPVATEPHALVLGYPMADENHSFAITCRIGVECVLDSFPLALFAGDDKVHLRQDRSGMKWSRTLHQSRAADS